MQGTKALSSLITFLFVWRKQKDPTALAKEIWNQDKDSGAKYELEMKSQPHPPDYIQTNGGYQENQPKIGNFD